MGMLGECLRSFGILHSNSKLACTPCNTLENSLCEKEKKNLTIVHANDNLFIALHLILYAFVLSTQSTLEFKSKCKLTVANFSMFDLHTLISSGASEVAKPHCLKSSFLCPSTSIYQEKNCRFFLGEKLEKLVKMLWFRTF